MEASSAENEGEGRERSGEAGTGAGRTDFCLVRCGAFIGFLWIGRSARSC